MRKYLRAIRVPARRVSARQALLHTLFLACAGLGLGVVIKFLDLYTVILGDIFSQMSVWIFLCTVISVGSSTPLRAAANVFFFCMGMLPGYYLTARLTSAVYSVSIAYGWTVFAFLTPVFAFCAWYAKGKRPISKMLAAGILLFMLTAAILLFDKIRIADLVFALLTGFVLLKK